ncbi:MAG TPA: prenyltransferase/squalene oxidase repeat-containing protein [Pirellulales bacterium]|nr:prenyltransferase/squalene oxidase repeat-containing protein [Pirellulales bacterium]
MPIVLMLDRDRLLRAHETARLELLAQRDVRGHWIGELSSSALSTATALSALALVEPRWKPADRAGNGSQASFAGLIAAGVRWLVDAQNADGGWGDTDKSLSNIATTMLVEAAFRLTCTADDYPVTLARATEYIERHGSIAALRRRYGRDKTFAVPILANCALAGLVPWSEVSPLPFELACLPQSWYRLVRLPVVSYAIPALVAVGQARYVHAPPRNPVTRWIRRLAIERSLRVLQRMQPASGGYLEATPLTSFVVMSLAGIGRADHPVARQGVEFLLASVRPDGSWPIDTNLATWITTLSVKAASSKASPSDSIAATPPWASTEMIEWLLSCQHRDRHPFTGAQPGGWGWSDLSGALPDADDTAGALLALDLLMRDHPETDTDAIVAAARQGCHWLLGIQNRDGGWPTFCRGWGTLPFDRSGADLTAHALRALRAWRERMTEQGSQTDVPWTQTVARIDLACRRGFDYLARQQRADGSWLPLWFGNQYVVGEENPVYGTAHVLLAYRDYGLLDNRSARRGLAWLVANQNADGGWGGTPAAEYGDDYNRTSSVEETAWAVEALAVEGSGLPIEAALETGVAWLVDRVERGEHTEASPVGFYFAKLWYYEKFYPLIFAVAALNMAARRLGNQSASPAGIGRQSVASNIEQASGS